MAAIAMIRMNHKGTAMDAEDYNTVGLGNVDEVTSHVHQVRKEGMGVISMKLVGEGRFTNRDDRKAAMRYAFRNAGVDAVTVGWGHPGKGGITMPGKGRIVEAHGFGLSPIAARHAEFVSRSDIRDGCKPALAVIFWSV